MQTFLGAEYRVSGTKKLPVNRCRFTEPIKSGHPYTPVVPVVTQRNGKRKLRLCLNYKRTLNDHIEDEHYVFPTCAEQLDKLKGQFYSCLDVEGAFTQVLIKPDSRKR